VGCTGMLQFIQEGGFPVLFILCFGAAACAVAGYYAVRPQARHRVVASWAMLGTALASIAGTAADLAATCSHVAASHEANFRMLSEGISESMHPAMVGFALVSVAAMLIAAGAQRAKASAAPALRTVSV
jgi:hypothetical protein